MNAISSRYVNKSIFNAIYHDAAPEAESLETK